MKALPLFQKVEKKIETDSAKSLYAVLAQIQSPYEAKLFIRDLCTLSEIVAMAERWEVAKLLCDKLPYREISKKTGASTATITRINHWIHHGMGGYEVLLARHGKKVSHSAPPRRGRRKK